MEYNPLTNPVIDPPGSIADEFPRKEFDLNQVEDMYFKGLGCRELNVVITIHWMLLACRKTVIRSLSVIFCHWIAGDTDEKNILEEISIIKKIDIIAENGYNSQFHIFILDDRLIKVFSFPIQLFPGRRCVNVYLLVLLERNVVEMKCF